MKKHLIIIFTIIFTLTLPLSAFTVYADDSDSWPEYPDIIGEAAIVMDADSGAILYEKNSTDSMYPASITKIITAMVAIQNCSLDETVTFSADDVDLDSDDATLGFVSGEEISLEDCLYALLLYSANECANAIAEHVSGSDDDFAELMNEYAESCGAVNTNFTNPSGLYDSDHYTCCYDMALMMQTAIKNSTFLTIDSTTSYTIGSTNMDDDTTSFTNRHQMLLSSSSVYYSDAICGKTGYLSAAGHTLVTVAERDGVTLICVVMDSTTDGVYSDTTSLLDYGFDNFSSVNISDSESIFSSEDFIFTDDLSIPTIDSTSTVTIPNTISFSDLSVELDTTDASDSILGELNYYYGDHFVGSTTLSLEQDSSETTYSPEITDDSESDSDDSISYVYNYIVINIWFIILAIAVLIAIIIIIFVLKRFNNTYSLHLRPYNKARKSYSRFKNRKFRNRSRKKM